MERCLSFDLEWCADKSERLVCLQACELLPDGTTTDPILLPAWRGADRQARELIGDALTSKDWILLGQNVAGDCMKLACDWDMRAEFEAKYSVGGVRCTLLRQRLVDVAWPGRLVWTPIGRKRKKKKGEGDAEADGLDIDESQEDVVNGQRGFWAIRKVAPHATLGEFTFTEDDDVGGRGMRAKAGLEALLLRYRGIDLSADKRGADAVRLRYAEVLGIPVEDWPDEFRRYALLDPVYTAWVCADQARRPGPPYSNGDWCDKLYPPRGSVPWAPLRCERFEAHSHFWFADMERLGVMRDQPRVEKMRAVLHSAAESSEVVAIRAGVVRLEVSRDMAAVKAAGVPRSGLDDLAVAKQYAAARDAEGLAAFVADKPWLKVERTKATGEIIERATAAYKEAGWRELPRTATGAVSAGAEHLVQVVSPRPDADPRAAQDLALLLSPDLLKHLQAWTEAGEHQRIVNALACASDPGLAAHVARQKAQTFDTAFLTAIDTRVRQADPDRWKDPEGPAKFGISPFKSTGRTGARGDVRMNMPKKGGVRECFIPRPGRVFLAVDYAACEMSTFADALDELVVWGLYGKTGGISTLGRAIREGVDCHLRLAATMRREPYDQLVRFYKPLKAKIEANDIASIGAGELAAWYDLDLDRAGAKEGNFGYGGGMGARKFARLQRKKGRAMTEERARHIRESWFETWSPEVPDYAALASAATSDRGARRSATVVHGGGGHVRGGLDYCQWMNTHFQEKAARGAKRSMILIGRACRLDRSSPLYRRADPCMFIHDEFIVECDAEVAEPGLAEVIRLMGEGMNSVVRTPIKREGKILRERWSK